MKGRCPKCSYGFEFEAADTVTCPSCGATMKLRAKRSGSGESRTGAAPAPTPTPPPRATPAKRAPPADDEGAAPPRAVPAASLPETMRANKVVAGRTCPGCDKTITLGTEVHNCPACGSTHHATCWDAAAGCAASACAVKAAAAAVDERPSPPAGRARRAAVEVAGSTIPCRSCGEPIAGTAKKCRYCGEYQTPRERASAAPAAVSGATRPCKFCGEQILPDAKKCRFCGEYQTAGERAMAQARQTASDPDADMGGGDWALAILCSGIGCIIGIVWCIQGKKKGPKMLGISIGMQVFWGLVRGCIEMSQHSRY